MLIVKLLKFIAIIAADLLIASCHQPLSSGPKPTSGEIFDEAVAQQQMVDEVKAQGGQPKRWKNNKNMRLQFERVGEKVEKAGAEICRGMHLEKNGCYYYFRLSRDEELNSKADGKNIIIYPKIRHVLSTLHLQVQPQLPTKQYLLRGHLIPNHLPGNFLFY